MLARGREAAGRQLAGHRADVLAVGLFVVGAIFALGLWTDLAGPVGIGLADGAGAASAGPGWRSRWRASPSACVLLWPRRAPAADPDADDRRRSTTAPAERPTVRIAIGALLLFVADVGILHLAVRPPVARAAPIDDLRDAGGALGAMIATPSIAATGVVGASVILGGVALVGLLLALGLSIGMIVRAATSRAPARSRRRRASAVQLVAGSARAPTSPTIRRRPPSAPAPSTTPPTRPRHRPEPEPEPEPARSRTPSCSRP